MPRRAWPVRVLGSRPWKARMRGFWMTPSRILDRTSDDVGLWSTA